MYYSVNQEKLRFLKTDFVLLLQSIDGEARAQWGLMNAQQMVEHFVDVVKIANGKLQLPLVSNITEQQKMLSFLFSEKPFAQNIRNPYMSEQPRDVKQPNMEAAIDRLNKELVFFIEAFENDPSFKTINPFFGELDYGGNVQLLHKHAIHHLKQFGLVKE